MTHAVEVKPMYAHAKAHWDTILLNVSFPLMCFSDEDAQLWEEDPHEYIRKVRERWLEGEETRMRGKQLVR